jgi:hypothetical protein
MVDTALGKHRQIFDLGLSQGRGVAGDKDDLGFVQSQRLDGSLVSQGGLAGLHHELDLRVHGLHSLLRLLATDSHSVVVKWSNNQFQFDQKQRHKHPHTHTQTRTHTHEFRTHTKSRSHHTHTHTHKNSHTHKEYRAPVFLWLWWFPIIGSATTKKLVGSGDSGLSVMTSNANPVDFWFPTFPTFLRKTRKPYFHICVCVRAN